MRHSSRLLASASVFIILGMPSALSAQEAAAADEPSSIVVTGSRIARPNLTSNAPISVVDGEVLKEQGAVNVEDVLNQLPQVAPGLNSAVNNGSNGTATVDVRGLGPQRTLVLVNGRRFVPATNAGVVDINNVPPALIERIDVVTGGASAVYGSDALGGVVNFILKRDFEGFQVDGQYNVAEQGEGLIFTTGLTAGANLADGRGNVTLAVGYTDRQALFYSDRAFFAVDRTGNGSATGVAGRFDNSPFNPFPAGVNYAFTAAGDPRPFVNRIDVAGGDRYNFAPVNYLQTPQKRVTVNALGHYDITPGIEAFVEAHYTDSRVVLQLAQTPATNFLISPTSPLLSASTRALLATRPDPAAPAIFRRRLTELGPRVQDYDFDVYQINAGIRGEVFEGWNYEVYGAYGQTEAAIGLQGDVSRSRLLAGLNGCVTGAPAGCVPVDAFGPNRISAAAANYIRIASSVDRFKFERENVVASLSGDLFDMPAGAVGVAIGAEYRKDSSVYEPSDPKQRADLTGFNGQTPIRGSFDVKEIFGEIRVPLLADTPFFHSLGIEAGARYSDFSSVGGVWTYKVGGDWEPVEGLRARALFARATRAPSVFELFQGGDQSFPVVTDPCARITATGAVVAAPGAAVATICTLQGLPDPRTTVLTQTNSQVEQRLIGNTSLREETAETLTAGVVFTPTFAPGFSASADYFDITVTDYVARAFGGAQGTVDACFASGVTSAAGYAANQACSLLTRTASGELFITSPQANTGELTTRGVDMQLGYVTPVGFLGLADTRFRIAAQATWLDDYILAGTQYAGRSSFDFGTIPEWKANVRFSIENGPFTATLNWSHIGDVTDQALADRVTKIEPVVSSQNYFDLGLRFETEAGFTLFGGVQNLFDNDAPEILTGFTAANSDLTTYDAVGRSYFIGTSLRF